VLCLYHSIGPARCLGLKMSKAGPLSASVCISYGNSQPAPWATIERINKQALAEAAPMLKPAGGKLLEFTQGA
jgi:hypothetical protein